MPEWQDGRRTHLILRSRGQAAEELVQTERSRHLNTNYQKAVTHQFENKSNAFRLPQQTDNSHTRFEMLYIRLSLLNRKKGKERNLIFLLLLFTKLG
jgi:hypothetical protein